jgi:hypothetical protein
MAQKKCNHMGRTKYLVSDISRLELHEVVTSNMLDGV